MITYDTFYMNLVFVTPEQVPAAEHVFWREDRPEAKIAIVAQTDGLLRFEIRPSSGAPPFRQVAPELSRGCHWLLNIRHNDGKTRIRLNEVGYAGQSPQTEATYDYDQARALIANMFSKD